MLIMTSGFIWILIASLLGFTVAAFFAGWLRLQRNVYLLFYIPLVAAYFIAFVILNDLNIKEIFLFNWKWGILGAILSGAFVVNLAWIYIWIS